MTILTEQHAKKLLQKVLSFSKADECECNLNGEVGGNIRTARNTVSTAGEQSDLTLAVQSTFGKRTGVATINEFDDASLMKVVKRSEELAKLAPENPENMPIFGPQKYSKTNTAFDSTSKVTPDYRAQAAEDSIKPSKANKLVSSGFLQDETTFEAIMNSKGLFAYNKATNVDFSVTIRTEDGKGSGWATRDYSDINLLDTKEASQIAIEKSLGSVDAKEMEPGKYTVILEPAASVGLLGRLMGAMGQRQADEGRSFLSKKLKEGETGAKNKHGEKMFDERVHIYSDPNHPIAPSAPFSSDGFPRSKTDWIKGGVITNMPNSPYWAKHTDTEYVPRGGSFIMAGGDESLAEMIKNTRRGVLVTRLWYIRALDPQTLLQTGLTRDGTFYIENGKIKYPIKNFRFNESPIVMLNNIEALGKPERINGNMVPPMKIRDFTFSSLSDAV
ncbi:TldD/PmbA family protein [Cognaticolwellia aestuarii]|jgi:predicted Zn-dependent protease|uniref:TldD/PmbA family protein n=1 Tax=Cognaticolwellia aestuarii TaxID=329993 RepID=UPI00079655ED|nr:TldD/PmbA family protein [Cognaticolwellia aestuarii]KXJ55899.1 MAG: peptidase C69 [Colwellia sp. Phe_37]|tara:strand:+ start:18850 stop:20184 length:1335 start_codon:yes stop_codon:yes gene_type:complete